MFAEPSRIIYIPDMIRCRLEPDGKLTIPSDFLAVLDLEPGDEVQVQVRDGRILVENAAVDELEEAQVQEAIEEYLSKADGPTYPADEVFARLYAHIDAIDARKRDAA